MTSEKKRIVNILNELVSNAIEAESSNIEIHIKRDDEKIEFIIEDNGKGMDKETLEKVRLILKQPHRKIYDEYYSGLGGSATSDSGLNIVGFQIDEAEVMSGPEGTRLKLIRYKTNNQKAAGK